MEDTGTKGNAEIIQPLVESRQRRGKAHAYNRKCRRVTSYWEVPLIGKKWVIRCGKPTKRGNLYCEKHKVKMVKQPIASQARKD